MRIARTEDFETALALDRIIFPDTYPELPEAGNVFWLAWNDENEVVGYASARPLREASLDSLSKSTVFLSRVGVLPSARRGHLQRRFIRCRLRWAKKQKFSRVVSYIGWGNAWSARALVREGFLPYSPTFHWAGDVLYLERNL